MGKLISIRDYVNPWKEALTLDCASSTLQVYVNSLTGTVEIVQMNDEGEAIRTQLTTSDVELLIEVVQRRTHRKQGQ